MSGPGPATVGAGAWRDIEVPSLGSLAPEIAIAVVLDGKANAAGQTRAALLEQSYPADLIEVIEPDSGREPEADVILLLEAGTVPAARFVEAHARWHHAVADAVSFGPLAPADPALDDPLDLAIDLTRDFTDLVGGFHLVAAEGTIGVRRDLYLEAGGAGSAPAGLRRLDLAYRLHCAGAVFVAEPDALASGGAPTLGDSVAAAAALGTTLELELPATAGLIPLPPFRGLASSLRHVRPAMAVNVAVGEAPAENAIATIAGVLGGRFGDFELRVQIDDAHPGRDAVAAAIVADARATFAGSCCSCWWRR